MLAEEYITSIDNNQEDRLVREIDTDSEWNPEKKRDVKKKRRRSACPHTMSSLINTRARE